MMDYIAFFIAILSMLISIGLAIVQYKQQKSIHQTSLNSKYHDKIFLDHLINKIPESRKYMRFNNETGTLDDTCAFTDELSEMLNGALYYKYKDKDFYKKLKDKIQEIEDYVMDCGNKCTEPEDQADVYKKIQEKLEELYQLINDLYLGR